MFEANWVTFFEGFLLCAGTMVALGAQNTFVLRQGIQRQYVFITASICFLCDAILIPVGVLSFGILEAKIPELMTLMVWPGVVFLLWYGFYSFKSGLTPVTLDMETGRVESTSLRSTIMVALTLSLLNPHIYLDLAVLSDVAVTYPVNERGFFSLGMVAASLIWYFGIAYGASLLTPFFQRPSAWRILNLIIGVIMWILASSLIFSLNTNSL